MKSLLLIAAFSLAVSAAEPARVSLTVKDVPLSQALDSVSEQAKASFVLGEGLAGKKVSAELHNVALEEAVQVLTATNGLTGRRVGEGATFLVTAAGAPQGSVVVTEPTPALAAKGSLTLKNGTLQKLFDALAQRGGLRFTLAPGVGQRKITGSYKNVSARELLELVAAAKSLTIKQTSASAFTVEPAR
jgi:type II secretory pathway component GspD/PulD (secretin)